MKNTTENNKRNKPPKAAVIAILAITVLICILPLLLSKLFIASGLTTEGTVSDRIPYSEEPVPENSRKEGTVYPPEDVSLDAPEYADEPETQTEGAQKTVNAADIEQSKLAEMIGPANGTQSSETFMGKVGSHDNLKDGFTINGQFESVNFFTSAITGLGPKGTDPMGEYFDFAPTSEPVKQTDPLFKDARWQNGNVIIDASEDDDRKCATLTTDCGYSYESAEAMKSLYEDYKPSVKVSYSGIVPGVSDFLDVVACVGWPYNGRNEYYDYEDGTQGHSVCMSYLLDDKTYAEVWLEIFDNSAIYDSVVTSITLRRYKEGNAFGI